MQDSFVPNSPRTATTANASFAAQRKPSYSTIGSEESEMEWLFEEAHCLEESTLVRLAKDGSLRTMGELRLGDEIEAISTCEEDKARVRALAYAMEPCIEIMLQDRVLICSTSHVFLDAHFDPISAGTLVGQHQRILDWTGRPLAVRSVRMLDGVHRVVSCVVGPCPIYVAGGVLNQNKSRSQFSMR